MSGLRAALEELAAAWETWYITPEQGQYGAAIRSCSKGLRNCLAKYPEEPVVEAERELEPARLVLAEVARSAHLKDCLPYVPFAECDTLRCQRARAALSPPVQAEASTQVMPRVDGKRFACNDCRATVFTKRGSKYTCNGCGAVYEGEPVAEARTPQCDWCAGTGTVWDGTGTVRGLVACPQCGAAP
jgi:hypothetical protein